MKDCGADVRRCPKQSALRMFLKAETTGSGNQFDLKKISIKQFKTRAAKASWTEVVKKARKDRNPGKQAFSLPYISHNVHYTKMALSKKIRSPLSQIVSSETLSFRYYSWIAFDPNLILPTVSSLLQMLWKCQTDTLFIQRLRSKIFTNRFVINPRSFFAAFIAAEICNIRLTGHKALLCQHCRTI